MPDTAGTWIDPDFETQVGDEYKGNLDNAHRVAKRFGDAFAPHEYFEGSPSVMSMKVALDAGWLRTGETRTEVAAQQTATLVAPVGNPRIDLVYVDRATGAVGVATGTPAGSPVAPALPTGKMPVALVALATSTTAIPNQLITDVRALWLTEVTPDDTELGAARTSPGGGFFNPIGSNLVAFTVPPNVVASAGGAGNQIVTGTVNGVVGSLTFNKTAHGRTTGQAVQVATSNTLPVNVVASTTYIVFVVDANNFGLYAVPAGWQFEQPYLDPATVPGGLTWGNPLAFSTAGVGNQTVTPGFVGPAGVTRVFAEVTGGGGGGGGGSGSTGNGGAGGDGGNSTFGTFTGGGGTGGGGGSVAVGTGQAPGTGTGGTINLTGSSGDTTSVSGGASTHGGQGGGSVWAGTRGGAQIPTQGCGGTGGNTTAAAQCGGGGGGAGGTAIGWQSVTTGTWMACIVAAGGTAGAAGTGTNSAAGSVGGAGLIAVWW